MGWFRLPSRTARSCCSSAPHGKRILLRPCLSSGNSRGRTGTRRHSSCTFGWHMRTALPTAAGAFEPVPIEEAKEVRKKTHDTALAGIGNRRLEIFYKGDKLWVQNHITGRLGQECSCAGQAQLWRVLLPLLPRLRGNFAV